MRAFVLFNSQIINVQIKQPKNQSQSQSHSHQSKSSKNSPKTNRNPILQVHRQHGTYKNPLSCNSLAIFSSSLSRGSRSKLNCQKSGAFSRFARLSSINVRID